MLTLDGDNDTWSVTVFTVTGDAPLKALRHDDCFDRVVRACPLQAHWLDGEPITSVLPMAGVLDRDRTASSSTAGRWPPVSPPSATRGPARTRRPGAA